MFTFEQYCYDALRLFDRYSVNNHNVLIGHSYGTRCVNIIFLAAYFSILCFKAEKYVD